MDLEALMQKAADAFARGKLEKAAKLYADYCVADPENLQARMRLGDAWARCGQNKKAIAAYQTAAIGYAKSGLLPRAIAASKLILQLDPDFEPVQKLLADLYAQRAKDAQASSEEPVADTGGVVAGSERLMWFSDSQPTVESSSTSPLSPPAQTADSPRPAPEMDSPPMFGLPSELPPELEQPEPENSPLQAVEWTASEAMKARPPEASPPPPTATDPSFHQLRGTLPHVPLFSDLDPNPFTALIQSCPLRTLNEGERIFEQGSRGEAFYVICSGSVRVIRQEGVEVMELARLQEGSFFGEMAILSDAPRIATVESTSQGTQLLEISASTLQQLSQQYPHLAMALKKFCRQRLLSNVMNGSPLFRSFTKPERKELIERFRAREVPKNTAILREGEQSDGLYVVLSGEVEVRRGGTRVTHLKEGDLFGEMSLLGKTPAVATIIATRRTSLLRLPRTEFDSLIMSHPQVLELVAQLTDSRRAHLESLPKLGSDGAPDPFLV